MSVYCTAVAVATALEAVDIEVRYLSVAERPQTANGSVTWHTLHSLLYFSVFGVKGS
jgi:hypothetical protein